MASSRWRSRPGWWCRLRSPAAVDFVPDLRPGSIAELGRKLTPHGRHVSQLELLRLFVQHLAQTLLHNVPKRSMLLLGFLLRRLEKRIGNVDGGLHYGSPYHPTHIPISVDALLAAGPFLVAEDELLDLAGRGFGQVAD